MGCDSVDRCLIDECKGSACFHFKVPITFGVLEVNKLLPCPSCGSNQIQLLVDYSNRINDKAKCRHCSMTGKVKDWNKRDKVRKFPL